MKNPLRIGPGAREQAVGVALLLRQRWSGLVLLAAGLVALYLGLNEGFGWASRSGLFGAGGARPATVAFNLVGFVIRPSVLMAFILLALIAQHPVMASPRDELKLTQVRAKDLVSGIWLAVFLFVLVVSLLFVPYALLRHGWWLSGSYSLFVEWSIERNWRPFGASSPGLHIPYWLVHLPMILLSNAMFMAGVVAIIMRQFLLRGVTGVSVLISVGLVVLYMLASTYIVLLLNVIATQLASPGGMQDGFHLAMAIVGFVLKAGIAALACWLALRGLPGKLLEAED